MIIIRTGGVEFVLTIKCGGWGSRSAPLCSFYYSLRKDINNIGKDKNIESLIFNNLSEWNKAKKELNKARDREGNLIDMTVVGISTVLFIPTPKTNKSKDWYYLGDKKALEHAKTISLPNKNGTAIY